MVKIFLILLLVIGIGAGVYLVTQRTSFFGRAEAPILPQGLIISNLTDNSLSVSWYTQKPLSSKVLYDKNSSFSHSSLDDRDTATHFAHHVSLKNLSPSTEYFIKAEGLDQIYKIKTPAILSNPLPRERVYAGVAFTSQKSPPRDSILYFKAPSGQLLSTPIKYDGSFTISTFKYRSKDLLSYADIKTTDLIEFYVQSSLDGLSYLETYAITNHPLEILLDQKLIPFFKVQLGPKNN